jgi:hypothetical protein
MVAMGISLQALSGSSSLVTEMLNQESNYLKGFG